MIKRTPPLWRILIISSLVILLDWWTKRRVLNTMMLGESRKITSFFYVTHVHNTGSAFGLFQGNNNALFLLALVILGFLFYSARGFYEEGGLCGEIGVALVLGGALGNLIDRIQFGHVIDFLDFRIWPVFNVADSAITVGALTLAWGLTFRKRVP
jgi:signal peptidase II